MEKSYTMTIAGLQRELPLCRLNEHVSIAAFVIFGDVPLTVFQSLPVAGVVVVTSPQELVGMIVDKAVNMADMMHVPVLGIVENMAYYTCPDCGKQHAIFGESHIEAIAAKHGIPNTAKLPIDPAIAAACDAGRIEDVQGDWLSSLADAIEGK